MFDIFSDFFSSGDVSLLFSGLLVCWAVFHHLWWSWALPSLLNFIWFHWEVASSEIILNEIGIRWVIRWILTGTSSACAIFYSLTYCSFKGVVPHLTQPIALDFAGWRSICLLFIMTSFLPVLFFFFLQRFCSHVFGAGGKSHKYRYINSLDPLSS